MEDTQLPSPKIPLVRNHFFSFSKKHIFLVLLIILVLTFGIYLYQNKTFFRKVSPTSHLAKERQSHQAIAQVGEEKIYQADLNFELAAQGGIDKKDIKEKQRLFKKIAADSIIIQQAVKDNIITADQTVYNSPDKDYQKRVNLVKEIREKVNDMSNQTSGVAYSIWFWNTKPGEMGVEKGKQFALEKITRVHKMLKDKKIDASGAGEMIKNDSTLSQIDPAYQTNAFFNFTKKGNSVTQSKEMDIIIDSLKEGEVSDIVLGKLTNTKTGQVTENYYAFATVTKKVTSSGFNSFKDWFDKNKKGYAIKYL